MQTVYAFYLVLSCLVFEFHPSARNARLLDFPFVFSPLADLVDEDVPVISLFPPLTVPPWPWGLDSIPPRPARINHTSRLPRSNFMTQTDTHSLTGNFNVTALVKISSLSLSRPRAGSSRSPSGNSPIRFLFILKYRYHMTRISWEILHGNQSFSASVSSWSACLDLLSVGGEVERDKEDKI